MNDFDEAWARAGRHATALGDRLRPDQVQRIVGLLRGTNFPGALSLTALGAGGGGGDGAADGPAFLRALAEGAAVHPRAQEAGLDAERIEQLLRALLVERRGLDGQGIDGDLLGELVAAGAERAGVPIRPKEVPRIVHLLTSGEFSGDLGSTTSIVVDTVPGIPLALLRDVPDLWKLPPALSLAL